MDKSKRAALIATVVLVALIGGALVAYRALTPSVGASTPEPQEATPTEGDAVDAPDLTDLDATVYDENGAPHKLTELSGGRPLVINFWATWCPFCVDEMPDFKEIYTEYGDRVSFAFIDVTDGQRETKEAAIEWLLQNGLQELPVYFDTDLEATTVYGARSLPTTAIIGSDGEIVSVSAGRIDPTLVRANLSSLT